MTNVHELPPGPYRIEQGGTADTYRIFAAGDDKPMVEMIYIGGAEDFAATAEPLAQLFAAAPKLLEGCDLVQRAHVGDGVTMTEAVDACLLAIAEATDGTPSQPDAEAGVSETRLSEALRDSDLDAAHDALFDLLEDPDAGNDEIRDAAITLCEALNAHRERRRSALARLRANAAIDRRFYDAEDAHGLKIGSAAEYECGTVRIQFDAAPANGLVDLVPQVTGSPAGRVA